MLFTTLTTNHLECTQSTIQIQYHSQCRHTSTLLDGMVVFNLSDDDEEADKETQYQIEYIRQARRGRYNSKTIGGGASSSFGRSRSDTMNSSGDSFDIDISDIKHEEGGSVQEMDTILEDAGDSRGTKNENPLELTLSPDLDGVNTPCTNTHSSPSSQTHSSPSHTYSPPSRTPTSSPPSTTRLDKATPVHMLSNVSIPTPSNIRKVVVDIPRSMAKLHTMNGDTVFEIEDTRTHDTYTFACESEDHKLALLG